MSDVPPVVSEYAAQAVAYVRRALGVALEYDSDTLPLLDHYLKTAPKDDPTQVATLKLIVATSAAYFGEVVRRTIGGRWELGVDRGPAALAAAPPGDPEASAESAPAPTAAGLAWRVVLPTGLSFSPAGFVAAAIARADLEDLDSEFDAPLRMKPYVQQALDRMGEVAVEEYYSLCGRLDTLEHLHEVLVTVASQLMGDAASPDDEADDGAAAAPPADGPAAGLGRPAGDDHDVN
jgi:hypothetical protein